MLRKVLLKEWLNVQNVAPRGIKTAEEMTCRLADYCQVVTLKGLVWFVDRRETTYTGKWSLCASVEVLYGIDRRSSVTSWQAEVSTISRKRLTQQGFPTPVCHDSRGGLVVCPLTTCRWDKGWRGVVPAFYPSWLLVDWIKGLYVNGWQMARFVCVCAGVRGKERKHEHCKTLSAWRQCGACTHLNACTSKYACTYIRTFYKIYILSWAVKSLTLVHTYSLHFVAGCPYVWVDVGLLCLQKGNNYYLHTLSFRF